MEAPTVETPSDPEPPSASAPAPAPAPVPLCAPDVARLREEQEKVVTNCQEKIQHWKKVDNDYNALQERLNTLPDKLSYNIMVPFGPFAFMPGKLVHTNEVTVLLGDNWFAKCSAKQAVGLVEHRKEHVRKTIEDLRKVMKNFESRVEFTEDLQKMSDAAGDIVDIREEIKCDFEFKAKHRIAHKPHSKPKTSDIFEADTFDTVKCLFLLSFYKLWSSKPDTVIANGEDTTSSEEEKEDHNTNVNVMHQITDSHTPDSCCKDVASSEPFSGQLNSQLNCSVNGSNSYHSDDDNDDDDDDDDDVDDDDDGDNDHEALGVGDNSIPTIYFSHTVEPKRVRINTGKNTTLKFSEKKEEAKRKRKNSTATCSDTSESILEEEPQENHQKKLLPLSGTLEAFSGTVIEKEFVSPSLTPHPAIAHPALPTIPERKEVLSEASEEAGKRVSKFKASRLQQKN
uniref:Protein NNX3 n=1 Tax=Saimiri boliviensis boliviensis TaxID=39432 RepID=A0A2K6TLW0_SAIBB